MNTTFSNSQLGNVIQFRLDGNKTTAFTAYKSGHRETVGDIRSRYIGYYNNNRSNDGNVNGGLYNLQKQYNADVVIGVMKPGIDPNVTTKKITCGMAITIPDKSMSNSHHTLNKVAGLGLYFIDPTFQNCYDNKTMPAHEFGHTAGLYHGMYTDGITKYNEYKSNMLLPGAGGYYSNALKFQTAMSYSNIGTIEVVNQFSDKENYYGCDITTGYSYTCGNAAADSVATLKKFAKDYNERGNWYK
jgi:hypothetical protein